MHARARLVFAAGLGAGALVLAAALSAALTPKPVAIAPARDIAIATLAALADRVPVSMVVTELAGLDRLADRQREGAFARMTPRPPHGGDLAVWLVRDDGTVRGFIALDPRNGCRIDTRRVTMDSRRAPDIEVFYDVCHGSLYDLGGARIGGPSPWALDELVLSVRGGVVFAALHEVKPGRLLSR